MLQLQGDKLIPSRAEMKGSENSLDSQIQGCSGPNLPKEIWGHIHSLLPMRDAAQVACVSQDFVHSWRSRPNLIFSQETLGLNQSTCRKDDIMRNFTDRVDSILKKHSGVGVKTLKFWFGIACSNKDLCYLDLDNWLQIAVKPGIEDLQLRLSTFDVQYNFPCSLLSGGTASSLRSLYLGTCGFHPTVTSGCLRSLIKLELYGVCIEEEELKCILSNSPALEWLDVRYCYPITSLRIPYLQRLSYLGVSCKKKHMVQSIESKAPNLSSFYFQDEIRILLLLGDTLLQIKKLHMVCKNAALYALTELPSSMPNLENLIIHSPGEEANTPTVVSKFLHLRFLSISIPGSAFDLWFVTNFLHAAPFLETLVLSVGSTECASIFADPSGLKVMPKHHHEKLKSVQILGFSSAKCVVEFTHHILESAPLLECLTLDTMCGVPRCSVSKTSKCWSMSTEAVVEAREATLAVERYIRPKVPSIVKLNVLEPCRRCHAAQLLMAGYYDDSTQCTVQSAADVQALERAGLDVNVVRVNSVRDSLEMYCIIKGYERKGEWFCINIDKLMKVAKVAVELIRIEKQLIPDLISKFEYSGAHLLKNAGVMVANAAWNIPTAESVRGQIKIVGEIISSAVTQVTQVGEGNKTTRWFVDNLPTLSDKVTNVLDNVPIIFK